MSSGNPGSQPALTLEARKRLLLVACTIDRLDFASKFSRERRPEDWLAQLTSAPWFDLAATVSARFLPRKLRLLAGLWRSYVRAQRGER